MVINNSPDITNLDINVRWDISGTLPSIYLTNQSTGSGLANCSWAFIATSPTGTFIHDGDINSPDITGVWANFTLSDSWPRPFNSIEWSGAQYSLYAIVKDSNGNIYTGDSQTAAICRPNGNVQTSKNTFGIASSDVKVMCQQARIYFQDTTYSSYKGIAGTPVGSTLRVIYPIDETGNIPAAFAIANYSTALVPISYSSPSYQFMQTDIYDYDLGNNCTVRIKYQTIQTFAVWCNIDLGSLVCEFNGFIDSINNGSCGDVALAQSQLQLVTPKVILVLFGILQPLTGIDVPSLIQDIQSINAFPCNCCNVATGIIPTSSSVIDGYNFSVNPVCGDISGTVTVNGSNITFNLQDVSYVVTIANESPSETTAFSIEQTISGCQKTYALKIDGNQLAFDILNIIKSDSGLVNLFNSIVNNNSSGNFSLIVDGKCIFDNTTSCNFAFDLLNIPVSTTYAILTSVKVGAISHPVNSAFNQTTIAALQSYINSLGYGTFVVTNPSSGEVLISSTGNTNDLQGITYSVAGTSYSAAMTRNCTGYTAISANQVVQNIINYLCSINDSQVETSENYTICYIDPTTKSVQTVVISAGAALSDFTTELLARGCDTINYIIGLSATTCQAVLNLFPLSPAVQQSTDFYIGTKNGVCARVYPVEAGTRQLQLGIYDTNFMAAFCAAVNACGAGGTCVPFDYFYLTVPYSSPSDDTMDIILNFDHPTATSFSVRYARIDNTTSPTYITIPSVVSSPYTISGLADGQYFVGMTPIYSDGRKCPEMSQTTPPCAGVTSFSAVLGGSPIDEFTISYTASSTIPKVRVNIAYPNGGSWSQIYTNDGTNINVPFPTSVYGSFSISMQPVCNQDTGFFGVATAPVILTVNNPNATNLNYQLSAAYNLSIDSVSGAGIPSLPSTGVNGNQYGTQVGMSGAYSITISGTVVTATKLDVLKNSLVVYCTVISSPGTFTVPITAMQTDSILIAIDSGAC